MKSGVAEPFASPAGVATAETIRGRVMDSPAVAGRHGLSAFGVLSRSLQTVEQQVEAELELRGVAVAGLHDVLGRDLGEVGVLARREGPHDASGDFCGL